MLYYTVKVIFTAIIIVLVTELGKRNSVAGALLASLPLVSLLAFVWLYHETRNTQMIADLSNNIFWLVLPSLPFFLFFPWMLRQGYQFYLSLSLSILLMIGIYASILLVARKFDLPGSA